MVAAQARRATPATQVVVAAERARRGTPAIQVRVCQAIRGFPALQDTQVFKVRIRVHLVTQDSVGHQDIQDFQG